MQIRHNLSYLEDRPVEQVEMVKEVFLSREPLTFQQKEASLSGSGGGSGTKESLALQKEQERVVPYGRMCFFTL